MRRSYLAAILDNGLADQQKINAGLRIARSQPTNFPPSCGVFVSWCHQGIKNQLGLPSEFEAWTEWRRISQYPKDIRDWSGAHKSVYWVHKQLAGQIFTMNQKTDKEQRNIFSEVWKRAEAMVQRGESFGEITAPDQILSNPTGVTHTPVASKKVAEMHIKNILGSLNQAH